MYKPKIDHVLLHAKSQLDDAANAYMSLGFTVGPRNHHPFGSSNHLVVLEHEYVEILGMESGKSQSDGAISDRRSGLMGVVFVPPIPVKELHAEYVRRQLAVGRTFSFSRKATTKSGEEATASFDLLFLPDDTTDQGAAFFCQHHTPELVWAADLEPHQNGARSIREMVISSRNPQETLNRYTGYFPDAAISEISGGFLIEGDRHALRITQPEQAEAILGSNAHRDSDLADQYAGLILTTSDIKATEKFFNSYQGDASVQVQSGRVCVSGAGLFGCALVFQPESNQ